MTDVGVSRAIDATVSSKCSCSILLGSRRQEERPKQTHSYIRLFACRQHTPHSGAQQQHGSRGVLLLRWCRDPTLVKPSEIVFGTIVQYVWSRE